MLRLIGVELSKLKKRWMIYVLLIAWLTIMVLPLIADYSNYKNILASHPEIEDMDIEITGDENQGIIIISEGGTLQNDQKLNMMATQAAYVKARFSLPNSMSNIFTSLAGLGPILIIILVASAVGSEYRWGTVRQMLIKGTGREGFLSSKLLGIGIVVIIGTIIALLSGFIISLIMTSQIKEGISWDFLNLNFAGYMLSSLGILLLTLLIYFSIAILFTILFRSITAGMVIGIVFIYVDTIMVALLTYANNWLADIAPYTIGHNIQKLASLYSYNAQSTDLWLQPVLILAAYCILFLAGGFYAFRRQDMTA
ncbi:MAG: ABC transporter permease subunit [Dehalococcoidales bacterium]|nr:ABC transporter permease subunit [Dehalococcoidales bacterium]